MQIIKVVFVSNYINHHQLPVSNALYSSEGIDYTFIQTEPMEEERVNMGWSVDVSRIPFVKCLYESKEECRSLIMNADIVIFGGTDDESIIMSRLEEGKIVIRYSERIYKDGQWKFISPKGLMKKYHDHIRYNNKPVYMLCSGAYVASDFNLIHAYQDKMFKWGYFPEFTDYNENYLMNKKEETDLVRFLWTGRMIDWKHPEDAIEVAKALRAGGKKFCMTMIGEGPMRNMIEEEIKKEKLTGFVKILDFIEPAAVREYMLSSDVYLFTSDFKEGWGVVLNESMNSGCAVIASSGIGAVPYLLKHNVNGMVYKTGNKKELVSYALELADSKNQCIRLGMSAYYTIRDKWNPEYAAKRLVTFIRAVVNNSVEAASDDGPLSKASVISPSKGYDYTRNKI